MFNIGQREITPVPERNGVMGMSTGRTEQYSSVANHRVTSAVDQGQIQRTTYYRSPVGEIARWPISGQLT